MLERQYPNQFVRNYPTLPFLIHWWCWLDSEGGKGKSGGKAAAGLGCLMAFAGGAVVGGEVEVGAGRG